MAQNISNNPPQYAKVEPNPYYGQMSLQEYDQNTNQQQQQSQQQWNNSNYQDNNQQLFAPPPPMFQVSISSNDNNTPQGSNINSTAPPVFAPPPVNYAQPPPQYQYSDAQQQQYYNVVPKPQIQVYEYDQHEYKPKQEYNNVVEQNAPLLIPVPDEELPVGQMSGQGKKKFLMKVTALWDLQLILQIILCFSIYRSASFDKFFFDYGKQKHKFTLYFFLVTTIILLLSIRFVKVFRTNNKYAFPMYCAFTISYAMLSAGCASGLNQPGLDNLRLLPLIAIVYLIVQVLSAFSLTILIITFFIWKDEPQFRQYSSRVIIGPTLLAIYFMIFNGSNSYYSFLLFYGISACWLLYYLNTVFKILNGKFNLHKNDYVIGCLLTYCQMIIPEC